MNKLIDCKESERRRCPYNLSSQKSCKWIDEALESRKEIKALKAKKEWLCKQLAGAGKTIVQPHSPLACPPEHVWCPKHQDCVQCWQEATDKAPLTSAS